MPIITYLLGKRTLQIECTMSERQAVIDDLRRQPEVTLQSIVWSSPGYAGLGPGAHRVESLHEARR